MNITYNNTPMEVPDSICLAEFLKQLELPHQIYAVEVNCLLVPREQHQQQLLQDGDQIELVTLVGGG